MKVFIKIILKNKIGFDDYTTSKTLTHFLFYEYPYHKIKYFMSVCLKFWKILILN